jgi:predicted negative regulator of RcsB-dependent stress response
MKAKRRHDLEENDLSKAIVRLPTFFELHGNKIMIAIIVVCLAVFVFRWQWGRRDEQTARAADSLATARQSLQELSNISGVQGSPEQIAGTRAQLIMDIRVALETVDQNTTDRPMRAEALVERGDLNWLMANMPALPGATTRPVLRLDQTSAESLSNAEKAYSQVLDQYPDQKLPAISARFGLAAIDENQHAWNKASQQYEAIEDDSSAPRSFKDQAKTRLDLLSEIQKPAYIAVPATEPTTAPQD